MFLSFSTQSEIWWLPLTWVRVKSLFVVTDLVLGMFTKPSSEPPPTSATCTLQLILTEWLHKGHMSHKRMASLYFRTCLYLHMHGALYSRYTLARMPAYRQRQKSKICRFLACFDLGAKIERGGLYSSSKLLQNKKAMYNKSLVLGRLWLLEPSYAVCMSRQLGWQLWVRYWRITAGLYSLLNITQIKGRKKDGKVQ